MTVCATALPTELKYIFRDALFFDYGGQMLVNVVFVYRNFGERNIVARVIRNVFDEIFHYSMKSSCADVFARGVYFGGEFGYTLYRVVGKAKIYVIDGKQSGILLDYRVFGTR